MLKPRQQPSETAQHNSYVSRLVDAEDKNYLQTVLTLRQVSDAKFLPGGLPRVAEASGLGMDAISMMVDSPCKISDLPLLKNKIRAKIQEATAEQ